MVPYRTPFQAAMMGGMAGLEGMKQPQRRTAVAVTRRVPSAEGERMLRAVERFGDPANGEVRLASLPESAAIARRLTESVVLHAWGLPSELAEHAVLLVSELVGNAVKHTGARVFGLRIQRWRGWIRVEVRDPSRGLPCLVPVTEQDVNGRGLLLVDYFSQRWGVDLLPRGKATWFEIRVTDR
jgi:anti-sigma regulatory factor (Ser/Thr protein kinase)